MSEKIRDFSFMNLDCLDLDCCLCNYDVFANCYYNNRDK